MTRTPRAGLIHTNDPCHLTPITTEGNPTMTDRMPWDVERDDELEHDAALDPDTDQIVPGLATMPPIETPTPEDNLRTMAEGFGLNPDLAAADLRRKLGDDDTDGPAVKLSDAVRETLDDLKVDDSAGQWEPPTGIGHAVKAAIEKRTGIIERETVTGILDAFARDSTSRQVVTGRSAAAVLEVVRERATARRDARIARLDGDTPTKSDLRREIVGAADDADVLEAFAAVFSGGAKEAKAIAGETLHDLPPRAGKPARSARVGDGDGFELALTVTPRTELKVDADEIREVIVPYLAGVATVATNADTENGPLALGTMPVKVYAQGVRDALELVRDLQSSSGTIWKSTGLDALVKSLENAEADDLGRRLRKAYGRVEVGEPGVKLERKPLAPEATS